MDINSPRKVYFRLARYFFVTVGFCTFLLLNVNKLGNKSKFISGYGWPFDVPRLGDSMGGFLLNFFCCGALLMLFWYGLFWLGQEPSRRWVSLRFRLSTLLLCSVALAYF